MLICYPKIFPRTLTTNVKKANSSEHFNKAVTANLPNDLSIAWLLLGMVCIAVQNVIQGTSLTCSSNMLHTYQYSWK